MSCLRGAMDVLRVAAIYYFLNVSYQYLYKVTKRPKRKRWWMITSHKTRRYTTATSERMTHRTVGSRCAYSPYSCPFKCVKKPTSRRIRVFAIRPYVLCVRIKRILANILSTLRRMRVNSSHNE